MSFSYGRMYDNLRPRMQAQSGQSGNLFGQVARNVVKPQMSQPLTMPGSMDGGMAGTYGGPVSMPTSTPTSFNFSGGPVLATRGGTPPPTAGGLHPNYNAIAQQMPSQRIGIGTMPTRGMAY